MNGIIFAGCSFTWGQGLWYYSDLKENVPANEDYISNRKKMSYAAHLFVQKNRWPRKVADYFNTFEVVKKGNGGSDDESVRFLKQCFNQMPLHCHVLDDTFSYSDIDFIIFQTSQIGRNYFKFNFNGYDCAVRSSVPSSWDDESFVFIDEYKNETVPYGYKTPHVNSDWFFQWALENNFNIDRYEYYLANQSFDYFTSVLKFYESKGIKVGILHWTDEYLNNVPMNDWWNDRLIRIEYNNTQYNSIDSMIVDDNHHLEISNDSNKKIFSGGDFHPSMKSQFILSNSVIKYIETKL